MGVAEVVVEELGGRVVVGGGWTSGRGGGGGGGGGAVVVVVKVVEVVVLESVILDAVGLPGRDVLCVVLRDPMLVGVLLCRQEWVGGVRCVGLVPDLPIKRRG